MVECAAPVRGRDPACDSGDRRRAARFDELDRGHVADLELAAGSAGS